jgi:hypothetical protein
MPDTLFTNVSATAQSAIQRCQALMPQHAPMINLVSKAPIEKGHQQADLPSVGSTSTVQLPTEGDEIAHADTFVINVTSITPAIRAIKYRISKRAERFSKEQLIQLIGDEMAQSQGQNIDELLLTLFASFNAANDVGTTNVDVVFANLRTARRLLKENLRANGGPAKPPIFAVLGPVAEENFLTNLGAQGVVSSTSPWIPAGMSQDIMQQYAIPGGNLLGGVGIFWDGYIVDNGSGDQIGGMFSKSALYYTVSQEWEHNVFNESEWIGVILRADADYGAGVGPFNRWGSRLICDGH